MAERFAFARELLGLQVGDAERPAEYEQIADLARDYLRRGADVATHEESAALVRYVFRTGDVALAASLARFRRNLDPGNPPTPYDRLALSYEALGDFEFADLPPLIGPPVFGGNGRADGNPKVLSFVYVTITYTENGYAIRTQSILENTSLAVRTYGRIGYPWAQDLIRSRNQRASSRYGKVDYFYYRGRIQNDHETFRNFGSAKMAITRLILEHQPDVVHAASNFTVGLPALLAARECRVPFVYEMRGQWELTAGAGIPGYFDRARYATDRRLEAYVAQSADGVIVLTDVQRQFVAGLGVAPERIDVVRNHYAGGLTGSVSAANASEIERLRQSIAGRTVIGYVGSLTIYEGLQLVIDALADHLADRRDVVLLVVGDGPYSGALAAHARRRQVGDRVVFAGRIAKSIAESVYELIDVGILPRLGVEVTEVVSPLKTLEILAHGKPLLASDVAPIVEQIQWLGGGELFRHDDVADFAGQLRRILDDLPAMQARYRELAPSILADATWKSGVRAWDRALTNVVAKSRAAAHRPRCAPAAGDGDRSPGDCDELVGLAGLRRIDRTGTLRKMRCLGEIRADRDEGDTLMLVINCPETAVLVVATKEKDETTLVRLVPEGEDTKRTRYRLDFDLIGPIAIVLFVDADLADEVVTSGFRLVKAPREGKPQRWGWRVFRQSPHFFCLAVLVDNGPGPVEQFHVASSLRHARRFCLLGLPLAGADLSKKRYSATLRARFDYVDIEPGSLFLPNPFGSAGAYLVVFMPWFGRRSRRYRAMIVSVNSQRVVEDPLVVELDQRFTNVLIAAEVNENLVDGSVVWLRNIVNAVATRPGVKVFVATNAITLPNALNREIFRQANVAKLDLIPAATSKERAERAYLVDRLSGGFDRCIVRGLELAKAFSRPPTRGRTDVYAIPLVSAGLVRGARPDSGAVLASRFRGVIFQGADLRNGFVRAFPKFAGEAITIPPTYASWVAEAPLPPVEDATASPLVVYAGKITREYGLLELLDAAKRLADSYPSLRLQIFGTKFDENDPSIRDEFAGLLAELGTRVVWEGMAPSAEIYNRMRQADVFWGWRCAEFESSHFEVSSKAVEAIGCGAPILLYPSPISVSLLGKDYEGFAETADEIPAAMERLIGGGRGAVAERFARIATPFREDIAYQGYLASFPAPKGAKARRLALIAHDFRFFEGIEARLLERGWLVHRQIGKGHGQLGRDGNDAELNRADVVFCEWCLHNAVWWSQNILPGKRLIVRFHYQELSTDFPGKVDYSRVERVVFISPFIMRQAIEKFGIPAEKCVYVPITVDLPAGMTYSPREYERKRNTLGLVGMVPWRKRVDLAVALFERLRYRYPDLRLSIKGEMPSHYTWMADRSDELASYRTAFARLAELEQAGLVTYLPYDDAMSEFYRRTGWILSTSDSEGCHTAVAEGGVAGAIPLMLAWPGANEVYPPDYVRDDLDGLVEYFAENYADFPARSRSVQERFSPVFQLDHAIATWERLLG